MASRRERRARVAHMRTARGRLEQAERALAREQGRVAFLSDTLCAVLGKLGDGGRCGLEVEDYERVRSERRTARAYQVGSTRVVVIAEQAPQVDDDEEGEDVEAAEAEVIELGRLIELGRGGGDGAA